MAQIDHVAQLTGRSGSLSTDVCRLTDNTPNEFNQLVLVSLIIYSGAEGMQWS